MRRRLVMTALGVAPLDLGFTGAYIAVSGRWEAAPLAVLLNLTILVGLNALVVTLMVRPLRHLGSGDGERRRRARRRLGRLGALAPAWAFLLGAGYCAAIFLAGAYTGGPSGETGVSPALGVGAYFWFAFVYGFHFAFYMYFAMGDALAGYRQRHPDEQAAVVKQPFAAKLALVAAALAVMPPALILQDLTWLAPVRAAQGLSPTDAVVLDLMALMLAAALSLYFVGRALMRPVVSLVEGFDAVAGGRLDIRLAPGSDDELGDLARRFNRMVRGLAERRRIEGVFAKYVAPSVARSILAESADGRLRGAARTATSLFADIEGFTALSEALTPDEALDMLNAYFDCIARPITDHGGAIVNLTGDGLHAVFNAPTARPHHAADAVAAALAIQRLLADARFGPHGARLRTRIGVHTGPVVAGSVGCDDRLHYTVYGDSVNVAARLESLNKEFGSQTIVSDAVVQAARAAPNGEAALDGARLVRRDGVVLRGRREPMTVYALSPAAVRAEGPAAPGAPA